MTEEAKKRREKARKREVNNFFGLWSAIMGAAACGEGGDDDPLEELLSWIFRKDYEDGKKALDWFSEELSNVQNTNLKKNLKDAVENLLVKSKYLHLAAGFALGEVYDVLDPEALVQVEYLKKRIHKYGIFPMTAKLPLRDNKKWKRV